MSWSRENAAKLLGCNSFWSASKTIFNCNFNWFSIFAYSIEFYWFHYLYGCTHLRFRRYIQLTFYSWALARDSMGKSTRNFTSHRDTNTKINCIDRAYSRDDGRRHRSCYCPRSVALSFSNEFALAGNLSLVSKKTKSLHFFQCTCFE